MESGVRVLGGSKLDHRTKDNEGSEIIIANEKSHACPVIDIAQSILIAHLYTIQHTLC